MTKHIQLAMLSTDLFICTHLVTLSQIHWCWRCIELSWVISILTTYSKSFMKIENKSEPKQLPCGTPQDILCCLEKNCNQHPTKVELKMIKMFWQMIYLPHILWFKKKHSLSFLEMWCSTWQAVSGSSLPYGTQHTSLKITLKTKCF